MNFNNVDININPLLCSYFSESDWFKKGVITFKICTLNAKNVNS